MRGERNPEKRGHGEGGLFQITGSSKWYTKIDGKRQSTGTSVWADALEVLNQRKGRVALNIPDPTEGAKLTYAQMREGLLSHRRNHNAVFGEARRWHRNDLGLESPRCIFSR